MTQYPLVLILENLRSAQNVGAIWRTADAVGVAHIITIGITPHPYQSGDERPPHVAGANHRAIAKTALGAETTVPFHHTSDPQGAVTELRQQGFTIAALEQATGSLGLFEFRATTPLALIVGNEVDGVSPDLLLSADSTLEIPMLGQKESLNVATAAGVALYHLRFGA